MEKLGLFRWSTGVTVALFCAATAHAQEPAAAAPEATAPGSTDVVAAPPMASPPLDQLPPAKLDAQAPALPRTEVPPAATSVPDAASGAPPDDEASEEQSSDGSVTLSGYVEAYYSHNFAKPENKVTNNRWLDERHNTFTLQTIALDVAAQKGPVSAKLTLMFGPTADRWYFEGASIPATSLDAVLPSGGYSNETWKHIQSAYVAYVAPLGRGLTISGGLMPTQVGFEGAAVKDNWNWSRSNLFNFLPFFHVGARLTYPVSDSLSITAAAYNGWNQATDLNKSKNVSLQTSYVADKILFNLLYLGGIERLPGSEAGEPWRNLFDLVLQYDVLPQLSLGTNLDAGYERGDLGTQSWFAAALYARVKATDWLYFAARGDGIIEHVPLEAGTRSPILLGGPAHVISGTLTAEVRPIEGISFRVEYRHDDSDENAPMFYTSGIVGEQQRKSSIQNTLTLGMAGWF